MPLIKVKPTSPGPSRAGEGGHARAAQGRAALAAHREAVEDQRAQQPRPHHHAPPGRRPQAALPHRRFPPQQGRHRGDGRAPRVRPEPQRAPRAAALRRRRAPLRASRPRASRVGTQLLSGAEAPIKAGNTLPLRNIPVGTTVHCVEMLPGKGAQLARSAGAGVQLLAREGSYAQLRLRSGEIRKVHVDCRATIGEVGNEEHNLESIGKAGPQALARHPADGARRGDEPDRPPARRRRRPHGRRASRRCRRGACRPRDSRPGATSGRRS